MKKIYRVYAHDLIDHDVDYVQFYVTEQSEEEFIAALIKDHEGTIVVDFVVEYSIENVIDLLNLYTE